MEKIRIRSAIPIYLAALVWLIMGLSAAIYDRLYLLVTLGVSAAVYLFAGVFFPGREVVKGLPETEKPETQKALSEKKRFREQRVFAFVVLTVCVVGSVFVLSGGGLPADRQEILAVYYTGESPDEPEKCVDAYLDTAAISAHALASEAKNYGLASAQTVLDGAALIAEDADIVRRNENFRFLITDVEALYTRILAMELPESRIRHMTGNYNSFMQMAENIRADGYLPLALDFNKTLAVFPANLSAHIFGVSPLPVFESGIPSAAE